MQGRSSLNNDQRKLSSVHPSVTKGLRKMLPTFRSSRTNYSLVSYDLWKVVTCQNAAEYYHHAIFNVDAAQIND